MTIAEKSLPSKPGVHEGALADIANIMRNLADKKPMPTDICRRVEERADRVIEELRQTHVQIDIEKLLRDARDET